MKAYKFEWTESFDKDFEKLDNSVRIKILKYIKKVENSENPKVFAKELTGSFVGFHRFRISNFRILVKFEDNKAIIYGIGVGKRSSIYKRSKILNFEN